MKKTGKGAKRKKFNPKHILPDEDLKKLDLAFTRADMELSEFDSELENTYSLEDTRDLNVLVGAIPSGLEVEVEGEILSVRESISEYRDWNRRHKEKEKNLLRALRKLRTKEGRRISAMGVVLDRHETAVEVRDSLKQKEEGCPQWTGGRCPHCNKKVKILHPMKKGGR